MSAEYRAHLTKLRASAMRILRDPAAAEDVAAEALARAWTRRDSFSSDDAFAAWTWRVARNLCIDHLRGRRRVVSLDDVADRADERADVSSPIELEEERRVVRDAFSRLNDRHKQVLYLREIEGADYDEIARRMGTTTGNARQVVVRARRGLRDALRLVADGTFGVVVWVRVRARDTAGRLGPVAQPSLARLGEAAAVLAIAGGLALLPGSTMDEPGRGGSDPMELQAPAKAPGPDGVAVRGVTVAKPAETGSGVAASVDRRRGSAEVRASVPTPAGEEEVWLRAYRQDEEVPSVILGTSDAISEQLCAAAGLCDAADAIVGDLDLVTLP